MVFVVREKATIPCVSIFLRKRRNQTKRMDPPNMVFSVGQYVVGALSLVNPAVVSGGLHHQQTKLQYVGPFTSPLLDGEEGDERVWFVAVLQFLFFCFVLFISEAARTRGLSTPPTPRPTFGFGFCGAFTAVVAFGEKGWVTNNVLFCSMISMKQLQILLEKVLIDSEKRPQRRPLLSHYGRSSIAVGVGSPFLRCTRLL